MARVPKTPQQLRNTRARQRGFTSYAQQRKYGHEISGRKDLAALPAAARQTRQKALDALAVARRDNIDVRVAARREKVPVEAVKFWAGDAVTRDKGRLVASDADRLFRPMYVYSGGQPVSVDVRGSRVASTIGRYHAAVQHYLNTGDGSRLADLGGGKVGGFELETDTDVLDELARRGSFEFESIYRMVS